MTLRELIESVGEEMLDAEVTTFKITPKGESKSVPLELLGESASRIVLG